MEVAAVYGFGVIAAVARFTAKNAETSGIDLADLSKIAPR